MSCFFFFANGEEIFRPCGARALQNSMWYDYMHGHCTTWQGTSFPDSMIVMNGPSPGMLLLVLSYLFVSLTRYSPSIQNRSLDNFFTPMRR